MFRTLTLTTFLSLIAGFSGLMAAGNSIGMAVTNGGFQVDHARVSGNATLFDGSLIETVQAPSQIQLNGGASMRLATGTRATVYQRKLILERGSGQMEAAAGYEVEARTLRISPATNDTVTRISVERGRPVLVAAVRGNVRITNSAGLLVANIEAGSSLSLEPQEAGAAAPPTRASGCLLTKDGQLILADQTTNVVLELYGTGLDDKVGNRIEILGNAEKQSTVVAGASQVVRVTEVKLVRKGGCAAVAKKLGAAAVGGTAAAAGVAGAAGAAGAATATGIGVGTIAVIGGVASAAAVVGGLGYAGAFSGDAGPAPASR